MEGTKFGLKKVWEHFGNLGGPLEHQGEGSLITKRKRIQKPRSRVQVQVDDPRSRVQDETWSRPALKRGGGYIYIFPIDSKGLIGIPIDS